MGVLNRHSVGEVRCCFAAMLENNMVEEEVEDGEREGGEREKGGGKREKE